MEADWGGGIRDDGWQECGKGRAAAIQILMGLHDGGIDVGRLSVGFRWSDCLGHSWVGRRIMTGIASKLHYSLQKETSLRPALHEPEARHRPGTPRLPLCRTTGRCRSRRPSRHRTLSTPHAGPGRAPLGFAAGCVWAGARAARGFDAGGSCVHAAVMGLALRLCLVFRLSLLSQNTNICLSAADQRPTSGDQRPAAFRSLANLRCQAVTGRFGDAQFVACGASRLGPMN